MAIGASIFFSWRRWSGGCLRYGRVLRFHATAVPLEFRQGRRGVSPYSTSAQEAEHVENPAGGERSLSSRMSFIFEQMDAIERERAGKDEAFRQIRAWRERRKSEAPADSSPSVPDASPAEKSDSVVMESSPVIEGEGLTVEVVHPWPEWIELMVRLLRQNYFDHRRKSEDRMIENIAVNELGFTDEGLDFTRDWTTVRIACLNFGRDRFDILRSLSRKDIQILVGHGCPTVDSKVVFSAKLLRKYVHLDEGDVCSACNLRTKCERAYLLTHKEDEARTLDVMCVLLTYGFDPIRGTVENKPVMKMKSVKTVIRKLLHEIVKLSAIPIDPNLPPPVIKKTPPKVKQPPPPPKKRVGRDDIEMKKGDWLCPKCDFMNFAKNTVCLQCDARRPKRELLPGEWECPKCNFLNYRRNMACFHCDHKRPHDEFIENQLREKSPTPSTGTRLQRVAKLENVTNAWNFDFDDNESDGAEVAAFEYADPPRGRDEDVSLGDRTFPGADAGFHDPFEATQMQRIRGKSKECDQREPSSFGSVGFDDFDDEEDDIDSYELVTSGGNSNMEVSPASTSRMVASSEIDDFSETDSFSTRRHGSHSPSFDQPSPQAKRSAQEDTDMLTSGDEFSDDSDWSPGGRTISRQAGRRSSRVSSGGISYDSEDEMFGSNSDAEVGQKFRFKEKKGTGLTRRKNSRGRSFSDSEDGSSSGSDSDEEGTARWRNKTGRDTRPRSSLNFKNTKNSSGRRFSDSEDWSAFKSDSYDEGTASTRRNRTGRETRGRSSFNVKDTFTRPINFSRGNVERRFHDNDRGAGYGERTNAARSRNDAFGRRMDNRNRQRHDFGRTTPGERTTNTLRGGFGQFDSDFNRPRRMNYRNVKLRDFGRTTREELSPNTLRGGFGELDSDFNRSRRLNNRNGKPLDFGRTTRTERSPNTQRGGFGEFASDFNRPYRRRNER